ncbi:MAG TPA: hypothetical protein VF092_15240 [Longimicrobium sp.]
MKKLRLDVAVLRVESFAVAPSAVSVGTVAARSGPFDQDDGSLDYCGGGGGGAYTVGTCIGPTFCCPATWKPTCNSCEGTCGDSCNTTCYQWSCVNPNECIT